MLTMNIRQIHLDSVVLHVNRDFRQMAEGEGFSYRLRMDSDLDEACQLLTVRLTVETPAREENPNFPFHFEVTLAGVFVFSEPIQEELRVRCAAINCPTILFPYLRETLADLTRRAGFPPLHLQETNFAELAQQNACQEEPPPVEDESQEGTAPVEDGSQEEPPPVEHEAPPEPEKKRKRPSRAKKAEKPDTP
jgi:preprotein translocase subunit SecB